MGDVDLPEGYRWATEEEMDREDAIVVRLSVDSAGRPYTQDEADLAVRIDQRRTSGVDPNARCPASGLLNAHCIVGTQEAGDPVRCERCMGLVP